MPTEREILDELTISQLLSHGVSREESEKIRKRVWSSVDAILDKSRPALTDGKSVTGLALGYVQSGKTTSIISLIAGAQEAGFKVIIALIATNESLLRQNAGRILQGLNIEKNGRKIWYTYTQDGIQKINEAIQEDIKDNLEIRSRTILLLIMKNATQIAKITKLLKTLDTKTAPVLIIDDEADSVSLNTLIRKDDESSTHAAITKLRNACTGHLYIQYTATPYANLLLTPDDHLAPDFVEILEPGDGYTGGYRFFIEKNDVVFRNIGAETIKGSPTGILPNMEKAIANFFVGAALMLTNEGPEAAPISMLINSNEKNLVQKDYLDILKKRIATWSKQIQEVHSLNTLPGTLQEEYQDLISKGVPVPDEDIFIKRLKRCFASENKIWLMNQTTSGQDIKWEDYDLHILLGANKLDRGFTVEGLTVTYMNRKKSDQLDTMQQRSRAFGYRPYLEYCRIFTSAEIEKMLRETVHTEEDLRNQLREWVASGQDFKEWASTIGLIISSGEKATRENVVKQITNFFFGGWHYLLRPNTDESSMSHNDRLVEDLVIKNAADRYFGQRTYKVRQMTQGEMISLLLQWRVDRSPRWNSLDIKRAIESIPMSRAANPYFEVVVVDTEESSKIRERTDWSPEYGLNGEKNLMQGPNATDPAIYPGDRKLFPDNQPVLQLHRILIKAEGAPAKPLWFLALNLPGDKKIVRR